MPSDLKCVRFRVIAYDIKTILFQKLYTYYNLKVIPSSPLAIISNILMRYRIVICNNLGTEIKTDIITY